MSKVPIIDLDALMGKELNSVVCAAYKMGCDQTREVYQNRIEKLEAALRKVCEDWDSPKFNTDWEALVEICVVFGERKRIARKALEGKDV